MLNANTTILYEREYNFSMKSVHCRQLPSLPFLEICSYFKMFGNITFIQTLPFAFIVDANMYFYIYDFVFSHTFKHV